MEHCKIIFENKVVFWRLPDSLIRWFESIGISGSRVDTFELDKIKGAIVIGVNIPVHVASFSFKTLTLNLRNTTNKPYEELTVEDINHCWHQLRVNNVTSQRIFIEEDDWIQELHGTRIFYNDGLEGELDE